MHRVRASLLVLAAAPVAWLAGAYLAEDPYVTGDAMAAAGLALMAVGLAVTAWCMPTHRRWLGAAGLVAAALGLGLFYHFDAYSGLANRAGSIVALGFMVGAAAVAVEAPRGLSAGLWMAASGGVLWMYLDGGAWEWQVGNLLHVGGCLAGAVASWRVG